MINVYRITPAAMLALGLLLLAPPAPAADEDASGQKTETTVMYLGKVPIVGDKNIFLTLQSIKVALLRPYSSKAEDANLVVCRIDKSMSEALEYLDCDTNRDYSQLRDMSQLAFLSAMGHAGKQNSQGDFDPLGQSMVDSTVIFENLINIQPNHRLHIPINGGNLRKLLDTIPMPTSDQETTQAPTPATEAPAAAAAPPAGGSGA